MLYYLSEYKGLSGAFNLFSYITFRAGAAALTALSMSLLLGPGLISRLRLYKIGQMERSDGPASHLGKQGTPTMGGMLIFLSLVVSCLLWMRPDNHFTWLLLFAVTALAGVGFWDDYWKL